MGVPRPAEMSRDEAVANVVPGKILYLRVAFPHDSIPKDKFFVVVGYYDRPLLLKINTDNKFTRTNKKLREIQFRITKSVYSFLKYDSYLDCGTVWYMLSIDEVIAQLMADPKRIIGEIIKDHANEIIKLTNISRSVIPLHKKIISESLRP